jgi:hypothetical protein
MEEDLLAALREILEASNAMTSGTQITSDDIIRYMQSVELSKRVIALAGSGTN